MQESALHGWRLPDKIDLRMEGYPAKTRSFSWDKRGRWLATSGANAAIVWPFVGKLGPQGKTPLQPGERQALVTAVAFHPNEEVLAIGYADGAAILVRFSDQLGLELDEPVWTPTVFTKNRDRLLTQEVALRLFRRVIGRAEPFMSDEHFTVDGTLIETWASTLIGTFSIGAAM